MSNLFLLWMFFLLLFFLPFDIPMVDPILIVEPIAKMDPIVM